MIVRKGSPLGDTFFFLALRVQGLDSGGVYVANIDRIIMASSQVRVNWARVGGAQGSWQSVRPSAEC